MFSLISRGLDDPRERRCLAACVALCLCYIAVLGLFQVVGTRIDDSFFAHRRDFLLHQVLQDRLKPGVQLNVTEQGHIAPSFLLLGGWSVAEAWGVWTDGAHADIAVGLPAGGEAGPVLQLWAVVMPKPGGSQTISLRANGMAIGSWRLGAGQAVLCARLPAGAASATGILQIGIDIGSPQTPEGGLDKRKLGFGLKRVELLSDLSQCERQAAWPSN
jgi:hypothetical protein